MTIGPYHTPGRRCRGRRLPWIAPILTTILLGGCVTPGSGPRSQQSAQSSGLEAGKLQVGNRVRSFLSYVPDNLPSGAPLVIVLHGSTQTAGMMRATTGYKFDRLADAHGFAVIYPNGYRQHWNDCRSKATYAARRQNIDDKALMLALIRHFEKEHAIDSRRVFAAGYSNGGHMAYRMALEMPDRITAVAAIAANLPTDGNCDCKKSNRPVPVMIINGTSDPINPYEGGNVTIFGAGNRGPVLSSRDSARYFARVNGHRSAPQTTQAPATSGAAQILSWRSRGKPEVALVSIERGGHAVPRSIQLASPLMGSISRAISGPEMVWNFFARQPPLRR